MIEEMKLSKKDLQECLNNLEGEKFLDAFCVIDWVNKTEKENKDLQQRIDNAIWLLDLFISDTDLSRYDILKILMDVKKKLKSKEVIK